MREQIVHSFDSDKEETYKIPENTTYLNWNKGHFNLAKIPKNVTTLVLMKTYCDEIPLFPIGLKHLTVFYSDLIKIHDLPESLESFTCVGTPIEKLPNIWPSRLISLELRSIKIIKFTRLPDTLQTLRLWNNGEIDIFNLPESLEILEINCFEKCTIHGDFPSNIIQINDIPAKVRCISKIKEKSEFYEKFARNEKDTKKRAEFSEFITHQISIVEENPDFEKLKGKLKTS